MTTTTSLNVTIGGKCYNIEVESDDYEGADPSVGIMSGGFVSYGLNSAEDDDGNGVFCGLLAELQAAIEADPLENDRVLSALDEQAQSDADYDSFEPDTDPADWRYR